MKLMQKILSHGLLIGFFVATFFTYLYRAELFPQWFGDAANKASLSDGSQTVAPIAATTPIVPPKQLTAPPKQSNGSAPAIVDPEPKSTAADLPPVAKPAEHAPTPYATGMPDATSDLPPLASAPDADQAPPPAFAATAEPIPEPTPSESASDATAGPGAESAWGDVAPPPGPARYRPLETESATVAPAPVETVVQDAAVPPAMRESVAPPAVTASEQGQPETSRPVDTATAPVQQPASVPTAQPESTTASSPPQAMSSPGATPVQFAPPVSVPVSADQDFDQQLAIARNYFWRRDLRGALQSYQNLVRVWPAQADAWGELGNLYFQIGNRTASADAYYRTITILLDQGKSERAHELLEVLYGLDAERASEIEQRFRQAGS